jgi:peptidoglycan L-alanyl-D-glutamate endopeptidase CwlK
MGLLPETASDEEAERVNGPVLTDAPQPVPIPPPPVVVTPTYVLGTRSKTRLEKLKPELRKCVERAIEVTVQDFTVLETTRSEADQRAAVASGNSRTMHSKHLVQPDGFAWAVDLGAWVNGTVSWTFERYANIAFAMDQAATELGLAHHIRWGCAWDRVLDDFGGSPKAYLDEASAYAKRHAGSDLIDAPHFEWVP